MKQVLKILILSTCFLKKTSAQNLVPNPSFEDYNTCPHYFGYINYLEFWINPNMISYGTPDFFHECCIGGEVDIPSNSVGNQQARTGSGYAGFALVNDTSNLREYIEVELILPLITGQKYCVEFYVSLAEISSKSTSNIGAYFSNDTLVDTTQANAITFVIPQVENDSANFLTSKVNWMKVFGTFTAQGGERFMTIGNFRNPQNTHVQNVSGGVAPFAYYYIDDISVTACDTTLININENENNYNFSLYPNPATNTLRIALENVKIKNKNVRIKIADSMGREMENKLTSIQTSTIDVSTYSSGIYFVIIMDEESKVCYSKKFIKE